MSKEEQNVEATNEVTNNVDVTPTAADLPAGKVYVSSSNVASEPVVNTEAAKAKATEIANAAKNGIGNYSEKLKSDKKVLGITIAVVVVVVLLVFGVFLADGSRNVVKSYSKAMVKSDSKRICKVMHKDYIEYLEDYIDDKCEDIFEDKFDDFEDEDYRYVSYKIIDKEKYDKKRMEDFAEDLEDTYEIDEDDVSAVVEYTVKFRVDDDGDRDSEKIEVHAVKVKGKWYVF